MADTHDSQAAELLKVKIYIIVCYNIMYHVPNVMFVAIFSNVHFSILGRTLHTAPFQTSPSTKRLARVSSGETMLFDIGNLCW